MSLRQTRSGLMHLVCCPAADADRAAKICQGIAMNSPADGKIIEGWDCWDQGALVEALAAKCAV